ncbi:MAG: hypothetical protein U0L76_07820 [Ruminococcus sp.]|nr:hypothetical protein [Ruminococcus sp.]
MAYENRNAAYDLSLFDDTDYTSGSTAPERHKKEVHKKDARKKTGKTNKVVTLPQEELNKIRRRKHNPLKLVVGSIGGLSVALVIGFIIVGQVQLTELNQEIISAKATLADCQSIYTQNQMKVESELSNAEIEEYAENVLGMTKASNAQKEFVTLSGGDKAEVSAQQSENLFTQFIDSIKNLWS